MILERLRPQGAQAGQLSRATSPLLSSEAPTLMCSVARGLGGQAQRRAQDLDRPGPWPLSPVAVESNRDEKLSSSTNRPHFPRPRAPRGTVGQRGWRASPALWHQGGRWERVGASSRSLGCRDARPRALGSGIIGSCLGPRPPCRRRRLLLGAPALGMGPHGASPS